MFVVYDNDNTTQSESICGAETVPFLLFADVYCSDICSCRSASTEQLPAHAVLCEVNMQLSKVMDNNNNNNNE